MGKAKVLPLSHRESMWLLLLSSRAAALWDSVYYALKRITAFLSVQLSQRTAFWSSPKVLSPAYIYVSLS